MWTEGARRWWGWALVGLAVVRLAVFVAHAAVTPTYGFVGYYTMARLVLEGQPVSRLYDDAWYQAQIPRFEPQANDIFRPNPPTATLIMLPLAWLSHDAARVAWTVLNAGLLVAAVAALLRGLGWPVAWQQAFWLMALLFQPVWVNFEYGQAYLLLLALSVLAWRAYDRDRPGVLGAVLGGLLILKTAGALLWPLALARRQWRALAVAGGVAAGVALLALPLTGLAAWPVFAGLLLKLPAEPNLSVTAYQTVTSLARHLFSYDAFWNPAPLLVAPALAWGLPALGGALLLALTVYAAWINRDKRLAFAAFTLAGLALSPLTLDYHFALALVPIALLAAWLREQPWQRGHWPWIVLALGVAGIGLDLPYQSPRLDGGAWALLAYPKLYGTLLLWGLALWGSLKSEARPFAALGQAWAKLRPHAPRVVALMLVALFWGLGLWRLDQFPLIHADEPSILAPGYKLVTQGVFGADMFTGMHGQESHYLEVPPLMSALQGLVVRAAGLGLWQARWLPVALGALTLALTFALGRRLAGPLVGALAAALALAWQWTPSGLLLLGSGLPLLDVARIARYDILVPVLGLSALLVWMREQRLPGRWTLAEAGLLAGMATLANLVGAMWGVALLILTLTSRGGWRGALKLLAGAAAPVLAWGAVCLVYWPDFLGQARSHIGRYEIWEPSFFLTSLAKEPHRYFLGVNQPDTWLRLGFWMVVVATPVALGWLAWRAWRRGDSRALWLLVPAVALPLLLALFENLKRFYYLISVLPLWAVALAWLAVATWRRAPGWGRGLLAGALVLLVAQAAGGVAVEQQLAAARPSPTVFFAELRAALPAVPGNVLAPPQYWFGLPEPSFRSIFLPFRQAGTRAYAPISFTAALEQARPGIVLMHPSLADGLLTAQLVEPVSPPRVEQFWAFMAAHHARLVAELTDFDGLPVQVYVLEW